MWDRETSSAADPAGFGSFWMISGGEDAFAGHHWRGARAGSADRAPMTRSYWSVAKRRCDAVHGSDNAAVRRPPFRAEFAGPSVQSEWQLSRPGQGLLPELAATLPLEGGFAISLPPPRRGARRRRITSRVPRGERTSNERPASSPAAGSQRLQIFQQRLFLGVRQLRPELMAAIAVARIQIAAIRRGHGVVELRLLDGEADIDRCRRPARS